MAILHKYPTTILLTTINIVLYALAQCDINMATLTVPSDIYQLAERPWSIVSYMFLHSNIYHIIINLSFLIIGGAIYEHNVSSLRVAFTYVMGGITGAIAYILFYINSDITTATLIGGSAGVIAIYSAIVAHRINPKANINTNKIRRLFPVWLLILYALYCVFGIAGGNAGGNIAHLGGILAGVAIGFPIHTKTVKEKDPLITKVEQSGFASLTDAERKELFNKSNH